MSFDNILKKVVQEISRELLHKNIQVKEEFIRYYAGLLSLDSTWGISKNVLHNRHKIQRFVKFVTQKLMNQFDPDIITLKMQLYFTLNLEDREEMLRKLRLQLSTKLLPLQKDILRVKTVGTSDSKPMRKFYKKLIYYITLHSGMGNPTYDSVFKEVLTAFKSIVTEQEIRDFTTKSNTEKKFKLNEHCMIVAGIRLFNRNCGKAGEGIDDIPKMLQKALAAMQKEIQQLLANIMQKVNTLTTILDTHYVPVKVKMNIYDVVLTNVPEGVTVDDVGRVKKLLVMYRQYEVQVRQLLQKIKEVGDRLEDVYDSLLKRYTLINEAVQFKIAVPALDVFPMFKELARIWFKMQDKALLLSKYNDILVGLSIYTKQVAYPEYERQDWVIEQLLGGQQPRTDADRMKVPSTTSLLIPSEDKEFKLITPNALEKEIDFQFLGFCAWKLVTTDGALIPGNPNLGCVEWKGNYYLFSSAIAMNSFNADARNFVFKAIILFRKKPELIHFLDVQDQLLKLKDVEELIPPEVKEKEAFSVECQTVDHPIPGRIVSNYKWNVWDLKRDALSMANLTHCKTSSTQTEESKGLCAVRVQTYQLKDQSIQTKRENKTNVPKPMQYLFGLRGRSDNCQLQLDLTETIEHSM